MLKKLLVLFAVLALLAGCGATAAPEPTAVPEPTAATVTEPTAAPEPTTEPEPTEAAAPAGENKLLLSTTTSTEDSGLLAYILPDFQAEYGVTVEVVAVGTGQSLEIGSKGDADVVLVHARAREDEFMAAGHGVRREDVMYNDFVILGPAEDPAGIKGMTNAAEAMAQIAAAEAPFVSRGDDSGTHTKELSVWKTAGVEPSGNWYISSGQGMGAVLTMADEQQAYTLSDRATYLARTLEGLELELLVEGDPVLFNPYGVMAVNPDKGPHIKADLANQFIDWLISVPVQEKIGQFGAEEFGAPLFVPDSAPYREAHPAEGGESGEGVALKLSGGPDLEWTLADLQGMDLIDVDYTNKDGETTTYTGVPVAALLAEAGVAEDATLTLVAGDGYSAEVPLADLAGCANCIVGFDPDGGLRSVFPDMGGKLNVKDLVELQVSGGGGGDAEAPAGGIPENAALKVTGLVENEVGWTEEEVRAMPTVDAESTNKQGETETYTGVPLKALLALAVPQDGATTVVFVADDGYTAEVSLEELMACEDCIASFRTQGGFSTVMPGFPGSVNVKGVIEIQLK